jgi:hypothetical protein
LIAAELATSPAHPIAAGVESPPCLIVNPRSFRVASDRLLPRAITLAKRHGAEIIEAATPAQLADALGKLLARGSGRVIVLAGDGTVQAIVDHLARLPAGIRVPPLLLLGGGRTNLTAADLGGSGAVLKKLESALLASRREPAKVRRVQHRHTLVIEQPPAPPRHGFFVAAALVDTFIRSCRRYRESGDGVLRTGRLSTACALLRVAVPAFAGREPFVCPDLEIEAPGLGHLGGPMRLVMATTLAHDEGRFCPYGERGEGALRVTAVAARAAGFWRSLPRLVTGRFSEEMKPARGYLSGRCGEVAVLGLAGLTLDGQSFDTDPARPVVFRCGPRIGFVTP